MVRLKEAAKGGTSVQDCATRQWAILEAADEHPPVGASEVLSGAVQAKVLESQLRCWSATMF